MLLDELWRSAIASEPRLATAPDRRVRLLELLRELEAAGQVVLPRRFLDNGELPVLPRYAELVRPRREPQRTLRGAEFPWRPELAWAARLRMEEQDLEILSTVNQFLREGGSERPTAFLRERSLELFGNDKFLEANLHRSIFAPDRLTLELLRCRRMPPPFYWRKVAPGRNLLVVENATTFWRILESAPDLHGEIGLLGFGSGELFLASVEHARELDCQRIFYFGDIDTEGLGIAIAADLQAQRAGLPAVEPYGRFYELILEDPVVCPAPVISARRAEKLARWLPEALRAGVQEHLMAGRRVLQENLGPEALLRSRPRPGGR